LARCPVQRGVAMCARLHPIVTNRRRSPHRAATRPRPRNQSPPRQHTRNHHPADSSRPRRQGDRMRRRGFITLLAGAVAWPLAALAQQPAKLPTIGLLGTSTPSAWSYNVAFFVQRLYVLGWIEGRNVVIEYRWAEGRSERFAEIAAEFVRLKVDVIVTSGGAVVAVKQATPMIPVV